VGNHQTLALDIGVLCEEFLKEKDVMLRGLAHPVIFGDSFGKKTLEEQQGSSMKEDAIRPGLSPFDIIPTFGQLLGGQQDGSMFPFPFPPQGLLPGFGQERKKQEQPADGQQAFAEFMIEFGAVPVSARNFARLMQNGESVLLFPGGVREAYKKRNEEYQLFWPRRAEFVRMAAKYGAAIVPFAAVGVDDSLDMVLDGNDLRRVPMLGDIISNRAARLPRARRGTAAAEDEEPESFVSPLVVPKLPPRRMYFLFQAPLYPGELELKERQKCDAMYDSVKASVEEGLQYLLEQRERDPYKDFGRRVLYEAARSGKQAPTFTFYDS
jgi:1-acyl-sn-glycerol-3-phosphate acyltransferase